MLPLLGFQRDCFCAVADLGRPIGCHVQRVITGRTLDIVDVDLKRCGITGAQETRQRRREHDRIANNDVAGRLADLRLAPRDRHDTRRAGERRNIELDLRGAIAIDRHNAGIKRERRLCRRRAGQFATAGIATGADAPCAALHAIDQLAVEVTNLGAEPALAEIIVIGRRRLVIGEIEDADIDCGNNDARLLTGSKTTDLHRNRQLAVRPDHLRKLQIERERFRRAID